MKPTKRYAECPTPGKRFYRSRRSAKRALKGMARPDRLRVYPCACGGFHLGHLSVNVISGNASREDIYG